MGIQLHCDLILLVSLLDSSEKVIHESNIKIEARKFDGIESIQMTHFLSNESEVSKIRISPILKVMKEPYYMAGLFPVIGIVIPSRFLFANKMKVGDGIVLTREPEYLNDRFAIKVLDHHGNMLGYIAKEPAYIMSTVMDASSIVTVNAEIVSKERKTFFVKILDEPKLLNSIANLYPW